MVFVVIVRFVDMIVWGLERMILLFFILFFYGINFFSCMMFDVEYLYFISYIKYLLLLKKEYCRDFGNIIKESIKCFLVLIVYYYISEKSFWYLDLEYDIFLLQFFFILQFVNVKFLDKVVEEMWNYVLIYGFVVR